MAAPNNPFGGYGVVSIYPTPQSMADKVDEYFEHCFVTKFDKRLGIERTYVVQPPTFAGLARYLGFSSRAQLLSYKNDRDEAYEQVINDARLRLEDYLEQVLVTTKSPNGVIFSLKNNGGWEDVSKQQLSGDNNQPLVFGWSDKAKDVIDISAVEQPKLETNRGVLPGGEGNLEGPIDAGI